MSPGLPLISNNTDLANTTGASISGDRSIIPELTPNTRSFGKYTAPFRALLPLVDLRLRTVIELPKLGTGQGGCRVVPYYLYWTALLNFTLFVPAVCIQGPFYGHLCNLV